MAPGKLRPQKSRRSSPLLLGSLAVLLGLSGYLLFRSLSAKRTSVDPSPATADSVTATEPVITQMATYTKQVLEAGSGPTPQARQYVTVSADLYLADASGGKGTAIWSTHKPSGFLFSANSGPQPFEYQAGVGGVVRGWEDGVMSMQLGETARLSIPWAYAYGDSGHPGFKIPPKADLIFEIKVLSIK